jgi:hypothetical protein
MHGEVINTRLAPKVLQSLRRENRLTRNVAEMPRPASSRARRISRSAAARAAHSAISAFSYHRAGWHLSGYRPALGRRSACVSAIRAFHSSRWRNCGKAIGIACSVASRSVSVSVSKQARISIEQGSSIGRGRRDLDRVGRCGDPWDGGSRFRGLHLLHCHRDMTPDGRHIIPVALRCTFGTRERYVLRSLAVFGHNVPCGARNIFDRVHE